MKKQITMTLILTALIFTFPANAAQKYKVIAEASIPALNASAQKLSTFADSVSKGTSIYIAGGVIALVFQIHDVSILKNLRILFYADASGENPLPKLAFIAEPARKDKVPSRIKFNKHKFPVKMINGRLFIAEDKELLNAVNELPPLKQSDEDITVTFLPSLYFNQCKGKITLFKAKFEQELSKGRKHTTEKVTKSLEAAEKLLKQCDTISMTLKITSENLKLTTLITPLNNSKIAEIIKSKKGELSPEEFAEFSKKVSGTAGIPVTEQMTAALSLLLSKVLPGKTDTDKVAEQICKFHIFSNGEHLSVSISVTPEQSKKILEAAGIKLKNQ